MNKNMKKEYQSHESYRSFKITVIVMMLLTAAAIGIMLFCSNLVEKRINQGDKVSNEILKKL